MTAARLSSSAAVADSALASRVARSQDPESEQDGTQNHWRELRRGHEPESLEHIGRVQPSGR